MITKYDTFVIQETLSEYFILNEGTTIPLDIQKSAENIVSAADDNIFNKVQEEYNNKSLKQIIQNIYGKIKNSGVDEFAKDITSGVFANVLKWIAKKVGEYSTIGLIIVLIIDKIVPFGILDSWFTRVEWKLGISILISLIVYLIARRLKKNSKKN